MKVRLVSLFSGYDSQALAMERLKRDFPNFDYELVAWCEIDKNAIRAHNALFPQWVDRNLGDICKADPNDVPDCDCLTYSFPCFVKGTLIHTERGYIPIEEVTKSDKVLTHANMYQRVLDVGSRDNAPLIKVRGMCFKEILCTPNHPFYVRKRYKEWNNSIRRWERKFTAPECVEDYMEPAEDIGEEYFIDQKRVTYKVLSDILDQPNVRAEMEKLYHEEWKEANSNKSMSGSKLHD